MMVTPSIYTFQRGVLRLGNRVIPLSYAESFRLNMRVALSILYDYFDGEPQAERKAYALHYQLGRRLTISDGWGLTTTDLDETIADILVAGKQRSCMSIEVVHAQRRDQIRKLCMAASAS